MGRSLFLTASLLAASFLYCAYAVSTFNGYFGNSFTNELFQFNDPYVREYTHICDISYWDTFYSADFVNGVTDWMYGIDYETMALYRLNTTDCSLHFIGYTGLTYQSYYTAGLSWSTTVNAMLGAFTTRDASYLYTIDLNTGTATYLTEIVGASEVSDIAATPSGLIYAFDAASGSFFWVDSSTLVSGELGPSGLNTYGEGMSYDPCTDTVYFATYNTDTWETEFRVLDISDGTTTINGILYFVNECDFLMFQSQCVDVDDPIIGTDPLACDTALEITSLPSSNFGDTTTATSGLVSCYGLNALGVLYRYTALTDTYLRAETCQGSSFDTTLVVFTDCVASGQIDDCVTSGEDECDLQSVATWMGYAGTSYWIFVSGWYETGTFNLTVLEMPQRLQCSTAQEVLSLPFEVFWEDVDVPTQYVSCFDTEYPGVLFMYMPDITGNYRASTCDEDTGFDTSIYVMSECDASGDIFGCETAATSACDSDEYGINIEWFGYAGVTYYILVTGEDFGPFELTIEEGSNVDCSSAIISSDMFIYSSTLEGAPSVWLDCVGFWAEGVLFSYTPTTSGPAVVDTCGSDADTQIYVFSGCNSDGSSDICLGYDDDSCDIGEGSTVTWNVLAGTTDYILVTGAYYYSMDFVLHLAGPVPVPPSSESDFGGYVIDTYNNAVLQFTSTTSLVTVCYFDEFVSIGAGDFAYGDSDVMYVYDIWNSFYKLHVPSCTLDNVAWYAEGDYVYGMAWSDGDGKMYAVGTDSYDTFLYTVNLDDGTLNYISTITGYALVDIAASSYYLYGYDISNRYFISLDVFDDFYVEIISLIDQSQWYTMAYDLCSYTLYTLAELDEGEYALATVDTWDGFSMTMATFTTDSYFTGFAIGGCSMQEPPDDGLSGAAVGILVGLGVAGGVGAAVAVGACWVTKRKRMHKPTDPQHFESAELETAVPVVPPPSNTEDTANATAAVSGTPYATPYPPTGINTAPGSEVPVYVSSNSQYS
ncbi:hypothetical protein Pelo_7953 [Pelomyxa schiedti]|nr:hypothetical protein Pelo_7953 [Pelomyxa schiedti]